MPEITDAELDWLARRADFAEEWNRNTRTDSYKVELTVKEARDLIAEAGRVETAEMHTVFNMGIGLCVVVAPDEADRVGEIAGRHGAEAHVVGRAVEGPAGTVRLPQQGIVGSGTAFAKD